jgi:hypothetical protein
MVETREHHHHRRDAMQHSSELKHHGVKIPQRGYPPGFRKLQSKAGQYQCDEADEKRPVLDSFRERHPEVETVTHVGMFEPITTMIKIT